MRNLAVVFASLIQISCSVSLGASQNRSLLNHWSNNLSLHRMPLIQLSTAVDDTVSWADTGFTYQPSPSGAQQRSLLYTLIPLPTLILTVPGLIAGPSAGFFYAGMKGRAWSGIGLRTLALGGMFSAFGICGWDCGPGESAYSIAWAVFIGSSALLAGSAIYDIATVKKATIAKNERSANKSVTIYPLYIPRLKALGLLASHRF